MGIENTITVDTIVPHQSTSILTEIMKNFYDLSVFENLTKSMWKWVEFNEVKNKAAIGAQSYLKNKMSAYFDYRNLPR